MQSKLQDIENKITDLVREYYVAQQEEKKNCKSQGKVHYAGRIYDDAELVAGVNNLLKFYLTYGPEGLAFEKELAPMFGAKASYVVNSGSSANLVAVSALRSPRLGAAALQPGDEVIVPAMSFPTTVAPIIQNGLTPVFIDVELGTYNPTFEAFKEAYSEKTRAIVFAHTLGNPAEIDLIRDFCKEKNLFLVEDCCDALGSMYDGKPLGSFGDLATCSFYPAHHITMGEGGAVMVSNSKFLRVVDSLRSWGKDCWCKPGELNTMGACNNRFGFQMGDLPAGYDHKYIYTHIGYNLKPLDPQCAIAREQLKKFPSFKAARKHNFEQIYSFLAPYEEFFILPRALPKAEPCWFAFPITVKSSAPFVRADIVAHLEHAGIETRNLFAGNILRQPAYKDVHCRRIGDLKNADMVMMNTFFIGVYPGIKVQQLERIKTAFDMFFASGCVPAAKPVSRCCKAL